MAPLSPAEEAKTFHLPPGYRLELVASEPMVVEPVLCVFDADSALFVAEMRSYVQDADGKGTMEPVSRILKLTDADGDGVMDRATVFADQLVLPRMVLPLDDRVLVMGTNDGILWSYRDADGDGKADGRDKVFEYGRSTANLEHQDSALIWGIDNWLYTAMGGKRHRLQPDGSLVTEKIHSEFAQWGLGVDDTGRQYFTTAGGERPAFGFQQHPLYGKLELREDREPGFDEVFPLVALPDVQGGKGRIKPDGTLNHFTACCGQSIYRGDALPDLRGNYFVCEPVGRLVRRAIVDVALGKRVLRNAHPGSEFLRSTDANFRPIWSTNGPDGCLYFVDMYRGIIQESNWVREGSYLRPVVLELGLDKNIGRGRIWRLVHESTQRRAPAALSRAPSARLCELLSHPNSFQRETAQKLLVLRGDREVAPALKELATRGQDPLGRMHALWTLEGLGLADAILLATVMRDADPRVRQSGVRAAEPLLAKGEAKLLPFLRRLAVDPDFDVRAQVLQSIRFLASDGGRDLAIDMIAANTRNELLQAVGARTLGHGSDEGEGGLPALAVADLLRWREGRETFRGTCMTCHGTDGLGTLSTDGLRLAPRLKDSRWLLHSDDVAIRIVLHGMTGTLEGVDYPGNLMAPQSDKPDAWIAGVLTYVRNSFGNRGAAVRPEDVARVRAETRSRTQPFRPEEVEPLLPCTGERMKGWVLSSSHGQEECGHAIDGDQGTRFTTGTSMRPGMWFQIDFGAPFAVRELVLDTCGSNGDYPRGFELRSSDDGERWSEPLVKGEGIAPVTRITAPKPVRARYLRIVQTGSHDLWWSIHELRVYGG